jgi:carboxymethylenebutenolidase
MSGEQVEITTEDGIADGYLTQPDDDERRPGVLLLMDAFGLREQTQQMVNRIADAGYTVLAPNLFYRAGRAPVLPPHANLKDAEEREALFAIIGPMMSELTPERIVSDGRAYLDTLEQHARGPFAITGYCMGGRIGWRIAAAYPERVTALGGFHTGGLVTDEQDSPHLSTEKLRAEVYLGHAENDRSMTAENIATLKQALDKASVTYHSEIYQDAAHGYTMADTAAYNHDAAERHFNALFALLDRTLKTQPHAQ